MLLELPIIVLLKILRFIDLPELLKSVSKVCRYLNITVNTNSILWEHFQWDYPISVGKVDLERIFQKSKYFQTFLFPPGSTVKCSVPEFDYILTKNFERADKLYWLDLAETPLSTLGFLCCCPNLNILNLSNCQNLTDKDFAAIRQCHTIDQLYLSFTKVAASTVCDIVSEKQIIVLDVAGVKFTKIHCKNLLEQCYSCLIWLHLSLDHSFSESEFDIEIRKTYIDCNFNIYRNGEV